MKKKSKKIVFFGNERLATGIETTAPTLQKIIDAGYTICAVVSNYESGRSRNARKLEISAITDKYSIPLLLPTKLTEIHDLLKSYNADVGVLVAYGKIVPESIIEIFPHGIINIHPSLLPLHRGSTPIESVILNGSNKTGVSIMKLAKRMDAGPVYAQAEVELNGHESKQELADKLLEIGGTMIIEILPGIINGEIVALPQSDENATYDSLISKTDGIISWDKSSIQIEREIRAYLGWPSSRTTIANKEVLLTSASALPGGDNLVASVTIQKDTNDLLIQCQDGYLKINRLKPSGKSEMDSRSFLSGYGRGISRS